MPNFYRYTTPVPMRAAQGQVGEIYAQLKRDLGSVADPIALHAPVPALLAGAWAILRETLVAARASYQIDDALVAAYRRHYPGDDQLLAALAWASFTAARRVG